MQLPSGKLVFRYTPIYPGSNFTWFEATKNFERELQDLYIDGQLIITAKEIEQKIIEAAKKLDEVRSLLGGRPLHVNSWYRPAHINRRESGRKWSRHLFGDAIDFRSDYLHAHKIYQTLNRFHNGGLGRYFSFTHIDFRGEKARW